MSTLYQALENESEKAHDGFSACDSEDGFLIPPQPSNLRRAVPEALRAVVIFILGVLLATAFFLLKADRPSYEKGFGEEKLRKHFPADNSDLP
jgi:hypothetical protein